MRRAWRLFGLDKSNIDYYGQTPYTYTMDKAEVLGRVVIDGDIKSPWVYIDPEAWSDLPLNMEFLIGGVETRRELVT